MTIQGKTLFWFRFPPPSVCLSVFNRNEHFNKDLKARRMLRKTQQVASCVAGFCQLNGNGVTNTEEQCRKSKCGILLKSFPGQLKQRDFLKRLWPALLCHERADEHKASCSLQL